MGIASQQRTYRRRQPEGSALYRALQQHLQTFLANTRAHGAGLPGFVERELSAFLRCGILAHGLARVHCGACNHDRFVAFSCKGRGFCPSCGGKRMTRLAAHLVDHVIPSVPVRQWVITVPHRIRYRLAYDHSLASGVLRAFWKCLSESYRRRARAAGVRGKPHTGAVTFIQRFGSALNLNLHFHTQCLDGVFTAADDASEATFHPLPPPSNQEVARILSSLAERLLPLLDSLGLVHDDGTEDDLSQSDPLLAACYAGSVQQVTALGPRAGKRPPRLGSLPGAQWHDTPRHHHARHAGFDLHASVAVPANNRTRLEQLLRYCARPPLSHDRLRLLGDGRLALTLKTPWHDGTTHLLLQPDELIQRLVALIPLPKKNLLVYHGVLAPNAKLRPAVVAHRRSTEPAQPARAQCDHANTERPARYRSEWARLMQRAFDLDVLSCPRCGGRMRLIALIDHPLIAQRILRHLGMQAHPPPVAPPRTQNFDFDAA